METLSGTHNFPVVHGIRTHVIRYGSLEKVDQPKAVLVVPGNPGAIDFYDEFLSIVHEKSGWPVFGLSHAGHSAIPSHVEWVVPDDSVYTIEGQIQHKVWFVNEFLPENVQLVIIGHSIGAKIALEMMKRLDEHKVIEGFLLFPTIEKMAVSPRGKQLTPILQKSRWLMVLISFCLSWLPTHWKENLTDYVLTSRRTRREYAECIKRGALHLFDPFCVKNFTDLGHIEMQQVVELDEKLIRSLLPKLRFYYGRTDHWCPIEYYQQMKDRFPNHKHIHLCDEGFSHAFIVFYSKPMGAKVASWLSAL